MKITAAAHLEDGFCAVTYAFNFLAPWGLDDTRQVTECIRVWFFEPEA